MVHAKKTFYICVLPELVLGAGTIGRPGYKRVQLDGEEFSPGMGWKDAAMTHFTEVQPWIMLASLLLLMSLLNVFLGEVCIDCGWPS